MIKTLSSGSQHIAVIGGNPSVPPISPGAMGAGTVRYNQNIQQMEVYDGITWYGINSHVTIDLGMTSKEAIEWAHKKMQEEKRLQELMSRHPGLKDLHDKFEMMKALCYEEEEKQ
jgi:hypothetical protein